MISAQTNLPHPLFSKARFAGAIRLERAAAEVERPVRAFAHSDVEPGETLRSSLISLQSGQEALAVMHINPDHLLVTQSGRLVTPERNQVAWDQCYRLLTEELARRGDAARVFVLVGPQGAGKSAWASAYAGGHPTAIIFDAILVKRDERASILRAVKGHSGTAVAVWFDTPLDICVARNAARPLDERVPEQAIRNVHAALQAPTSDEGFDEVIIVSADLPPDRRSTFGAERLESEVGRGEERFRAGAVALRSPGAVDSVAVVVTSAESRSSGAIRSERAAADGAFTSPEGAEFALRSAASKWGRTVGARPHLVAVDRQV